VCPEPCPRTAPRRPLRGAHHRRAAPDGASGSGARHRVPALPHCRPAALPPCRPAACRPATLPHCHTAALPCPLRRALRLRTPRTRWLPVGLCGPLAAAYGVHGQHRRPLRPCVDGRRRAPLRAYVLLAGVPERADGGVGLPQALLQRRAAVVRRRDVEHAAPRALARHAARCRMVATVVVTGCASRVGSHSPRHAPCCFL